MRYLVAYLIIINLFAFFQMYFDKSAARRRRRRIPERRLFITAALGGSIGSLAGMYLFRHKTQHRSFCIGMPAILLVQLGAYLFYIFRIMPS